LAADLDFRAAMQDDSINLSEETMNLVAFERYDLDTEYGD